MFVTNNISKALILFLAFAFTSTVFAQQEIPPRGPVSFDVFDQNGDGFISEDEFNLIHEKRIEQREKEGGMMKNREYAPSFSDIDTDGNGKINKQEFNTHRIQQRKERQQMN